jgi:flagellar motor switch protein FliN
MKKGKRRTLEVAAELVLEAFKKRLPSERMERIERAGFIAHDQVRWFKASFLGPSPFSLHIAVSDIAERIVAKADPESAAAKIEQVFQELGRTLSALAGEKIWCSAVAEEAPQETASTVRYELFPVTGPAGEVILSMPESTIDVLTEDISFGAPSESGRTMDVLMNIDLPVTISFGSVEIPLGEVLKLTTGSIVELNHRLNEPVDIVVNRCLVARGEVVVVDGNYGVRISEVRGNGG